MRRGRPLLLLLLLALAAPAAAQNLPPYFKLTEVGPGAGFTQPVGIALAEDGRIFVAERRGTVQILEPDPGAADPRSGYRKRATPFLDLQLEVLDHWDRGLLALALDPDFASNGHVYVAYVVETDSLAPDQYQYAYSRVERYTASAGDPNVADPASRLTLIGATWPEGITTAHNSHTVGTLLFGDDGTLLFSHGDGAHYDGAPDGGGRDPEQFLPGRSDPAEDIGAFRAQDLGSLSGKVLRIDPSTGAGVPSNPYYEPGDPFSDASRTWARGLRNPFRMTHVPGSGATDPAVGDPGRLYVGDVGWERWEEVNLCEGGENFGWPCYEGSGEQSGYQALNPPTGGCPPDGSGMSSPVIEWPHPNVSGSSQPTPGLVGNASAGVAWQDSPSFHRLYRDVLYFADYTQNWIRGARVDGTGAATELFSFASWLGRPVQLVVDPTSGDLFYVAYEYQQVRRIYYDPPSSAGAPASPTGLTANPTAGSVSLHWQWSPELDVVGYDILRADSPTGPWTQLNTSLLSEETFTDDGGVGGLESGRVYYYAVRAVDDELPAQTSAPSGAVLAIPSAKWWEWYRPVAGPVLELVEAPAPFPRTVDLPQGVASNFDHGAVNDNAPQLRRSLLADEDFDLRTRIALEEYVDGKKFHTGLMVAFGSNDIFTWGFYRGLELRVERTGQGSLITAAQSDADLELRVQRSGSDFSFEYRVGENDPWIVAGVQSTPDPVQWVGWIGKTWESWAPVGVRLGHLAVNEIAPVASATATPTSGATPLVVDFDSGSFDPDGDILTHHWDLGDGAQSTERALQHEYLLPGAYDVVLTVRDGSGLETAADSLRITVEGNQPPTALVVAPLDGLEYVDPLQPIALAGSGTDPDGDDLLLQYAWSVDLLHGGIRTPAYLVPPAGASSSFIPATGDDGQGIELEIILTVTDPGGLTAADTVRVYDRVLPPTPILELRASLADGAAPPTVPGAASPWVDLSGSGADASLLGFASPDGQSGWNGSGVPGDPHRLELDGLDDVAVVAAGDLGALAGATGASVELWLRTPVDVIARSYVLEWLESYASPFPGFSLAIEGGWLRLYLDPWQDLAPVLPDSWIHVVCVKDGDLWSAWVDGQQVAGGHGAQLGDPSSGLVLGAGTFAGSGQYGEHLRGAIAELRVYDFGLSAANLSVLSAQPPAVYANPPVLTGLDPDSGRNDAELSGFRVRGRHLGAGSSLRLGRAGAPDLLGSSISAQDSILVADLPLVDAAEGDWDVVVTAPSGLEGRWDGGFTVLPPSTLFLELDAAQIDGLAPPVVPGAASPWTDTVGAIEAALVGFGSGDGASGWQGDGSANSPYRLRFDGLDDRVAVAAGAVAGLQAFDELTVELWFAPGADLQRSQVLLDWAESLDAPRPGCQLVILEAQLWLRDDPAGGLLPLGPLTPGAFHHVSLVYQAGGLSARLDGSPVLDLPVADRGDQLTELLLGAALGSTVGASQAHFGGEIAVLRLWGEASDAASLEARRQADLPRFTPPDRARLRLQPTVADRMPGAPFQLELHYDDLGIPFDLRAASLRLHYDPSVVEVLGATEGELLQDTGLPTFFAADTGTPGQVDLDLTVLGTGVGAAGAGALARIDFRVLTTAPEGPSPLGLEVLSLLDVQNPPQPIAHVAFGATRTVDATPPAGVAALEAIPLHGAVSLAWDDAVDDRTGVTVFYRPWTLGAAEGYPEFDDQGPAPDWPADLVAARDSLGGWTELMLPDSTAAGVLVHPERTVLSVLMLAHDAAGNLSEFAAAPRLRIPTYRLGDLGELDPAGLPVPVFDGAVDGLRDLPVISRAYGTSEGQPGYDPRCDIGPTSTGDRHGIPLTDSTVDFEDLLMFAQDFDPPPAARAGGLVRVGPAAPEGPLRLELGEGRSADARPGSLVELPLLLHGNPGDLQGLHLELAYDPERLAYRGARAADLLARSEAPVLLLDRWSTPGRLVLDLVVVGRGAHLGGDGPLASLTFEFRGGRGGEIVPLSVSARSVTGEERTAVVDGLARSGVVPAPVAHRLYAARPNPFNPSTRIAFELPQAGRVRLRVYDVAGRLVRTLAEGDFLAGYHELPWHGRDDRGRGVSSGVYLYELVAPGFRAVQKMMLVK